MGPRYEADQLLLERIQRKEEIHSHLEQKAASPSSTQLDLTVSLPVSVLLGEARFRPLRLGIVESLDYLLLDREYAVFSHVEGGIVLVAIRRRRDVQLQLELVTDKSRYELGVGGRSNGDCLASICFYPVHLRGVRATVTMANQRCFFEAWVQELRFGETYSLP
jgi:hypothetical protein